MATYTVYASNGGQDTYDTKKAAQAQVRYLKKHRPGLKTRIEKNEDTPNNED